MSQYPLVSVYVTTFNDLNFLKQCLRSVERQSYKNIEVIVADDGSSDGTQEYMEYVVRRGRPIRYFRNPVNEGQAVNQQKFIHQVSGEIVTILQSDDYYMTDNFIEMAVNNFISHPELSMCWCSARMSYFGTRRYSWVGGCVQNYFNDGMAAAKKLMQEGYWPSTMVARTAAFRLVGGFRSEVGVGMDLFCAAALACEGATIYSPVTHVNARVHQRSLTGRLGYGALYEQLRPAVQRMDIELFDGRSDLMSILENLIAIEKSGLRLKFQKKYLQSRIRELSREPEIKEGVVIYGAGQHSDRLLAWTDMTGINIKGFSDSSEAMHGKSFHEFFIYSPAEVKDLLMQGEVSSVLISSMVFQDEISNSLRSQGVPSEKIFVLY